jgi:hypothetical protein
MFLWMNTVVECVSVKSNSLSFRSNEVNDDTAAPAAKPGQKRKATGVKAGGKSKKAKLTACDEPNALDMTSIHPESYDVAERWVPYLF